MPNTKSTRNAASKRPKTERFDPRVLDKRVISLPLMEILQRDRGVDPISVIIDLNLNYTGGRKGARDQVDDLLTEIIGVDKSQGINVALSDHSRQYLFAELKKSTIEELVRQDNSGAGVPVAPQRAIYRIWPDFDVEASTNKSISTVKADAAHAAFAAYGEDIVWAVLDSGIDANHPHFRMHGNLNVDLPLKSLDFTVLQQEEGAPYVDEFGHGTHVAGIIAGELIADETEQIVAGVSQQDENGDVQHRAITLKRISGMAPRCKLLSLKVLDENGKGKTSRIIAALEHIQEINGYGRAIHIHGANLSLGYDFDPRWFACGQSPLCVEVNRLVRTGVVVVVAAGNTGFGALAGTSRGTVSAGMDLTINDPGNADLAITVGSTHRDKPHVFGVSFFLPRVQPEMAGLSLIWWRPGRELSHVRQGITGAHCRRSLKPKSAVYVEDSGTSMAAPHVSGVIAAFLSVRQEFIGQPEKVKAYFLTTATDLKRDRSFQGQGLVDLMRAIQSI